MSEDAEQATVSLQDVIEEDQQLEDTANAVLGDSDDTQCTYPKGYVGRQALYACETCIPAESVSLAGVCLACSLHCHDGHTLHELYTKRQFRCDCGNGKFTKVTCSLCPDKEGENNGNKYSHNFRGLYCTCDRAYPDSEDEIEDEMIQCCICEDWFHSRHLGGTIPKSFSEIACDSCMTSHDFLTSYRLRSDPVKMVDGESDDGIDVTGTTSPASESNGQMVVKAMENSKPLPDLQTRVRSDMEGLTVDCELVRRRQLLCGSEDSSSLAGMPSSASSVKRQAGFFEEDWRAKLCKCSSCMVLYTTEAVLFLLDEADSVSAYEKRGSSRPNIHDAGMEALGSTLNRVQQVEVFHQYNDLKTELSQYLRGFAQDGKVVSKRDIEEFFEGMHERKRQKLDTGEGIPPSQCHF